MLIPPLTPMLPSAANDISMLFGQKPIFEEMDDWGDESIEVARKSTSLPLDKEVYIPSLKEWEDAELGRDMGGERELDLILEDEVYTGRGERVLLDDPSVVSERSFGAEGSASVVESELPSVYLAEQLRRPPTPLQDDYFQRRLSSSRQRSSSLISVAPSHFIPSRALELTPQAQPSRHFMPTSDSAGSLAQTVGSWTSEEKSIMQVQMAWRSKPEMSRAQHIRTDSLVLAQQARPLSPDDEEGTAQIGVRLPQHSKRPSLARFGPPQRIIRPTEPSRFEPGADESLEYGRYDADQALLMESARVYHPPFGQTRHSRLPSSSTMPLNLSIASRHSRMASVTSITSIPLEMHGEDIPFPTLADTSGSADSIGVRTERRKSSSEKLLSFFTGFLSGTGSGAGWQEDPVEIETRDAAVDSGYFPAPELSGHQVTVDDSIELPRAGADIQESPYEYEIPAARVRVERAPAPTRRPVHTDFIELQPPAFEEDIRPPSRPSNAPYFALGPSRTVPSASSNFAAPAPTFDRKGKGRPTMSAFACAALARLPPPGKGSSSSGQPVTIRDSERARDLDRRKSIFEGPSRMLPRPAPMRRTIPIAGRTPGKASRARAMQRGQFDYGVKERMEIKDREKRKLDRMREEEEVKEYKKRRRETVIRANPLPEMYRR